MLKNSLSHNNVPLASSKSVSLAEVGHCVIARKYISERKIKEMAVEKYRSSGYGITFQDLTNRFPIKKPRAQRSLKHFHERGVLFTAKDLISQGIDLIQNTNPQQYFPTSIKAAIIEDIKKRRNVLVQPTGVNLPKGSLISNKHPLSNTLEYQKAQSFLDVLLQLRFAPLYIHKLLLMLSIDKQYYNELVQKEGRINRSKRHEEIIGRRLVRYIFSPNGTVEIGVRCNDTPFRLESDEDESIIFSFLGQVKDRLLYCTKDIRERSIPPVTEWILKACDLNKDVKIDDTCQLTLPDIQLKDADRVFRLYVKSFHDKAAYRSEESLTTDRMLLKEALDNIRYPYKSIENTIEQIKNQVDKIDRKIDVITSPAKATNNNNTNGQDLPASSEGSDNLTSNSGEV